MHEHEEENDWTEEELAELQEEDTSLPPEEEPEAPGLRDEKGRFREGLPHPARLHPKHLQGSYPASTEKDEACGWQLLEVPDSIPKAPLPKTHAPAFIKRQPTKTGKKKAWTLAHIRNCISKSFTPRMHARLLKRLYDLGMAGNVMAAKEFFDRTLGKAKDSVELSIEQRSLTVNVNLSPQEEEVMQKLLIKSQGLLIEEEKKYEDQIIEEEPLATEEQQPN